MILEQFNLQGKVAIVTGASRGLGKGVAIALAEAGADVVGVGVSDSSATAESVTALGRRYLAITADLSDKESAKTSIAYIIEKTKATFGKIDILVNNAGTIRRNDFLAFTEEEWDTVMDLNLRNLFFLSQAVASEFIEQNSGGKIIHIASMLSFQGGLRVPSYTSSKSCVKRLTMSMANELAPNEFEKSLGAKIDFILPEDPKAAKAAINGKPLAAGVNRGRIAESMSGLSKLLGGISDDKKSRRSWFSFKR